MTEETSPEETPSEAVGDPSSLEEILARLNQVRHAIERTPREDFARRTDLREEQLRLREQASEYRRVHGLGRPPAELRAELESLRSRVREVKGRRINPGVMAGGSHGGDLSGIEMVRLNRAVEEGGGLPELEQRILTLERILEEQTGSPNQPN